MLDADSIIVDLGANRGSSPPRCTGVWHARGGCGAEPGTPRTGRVPVVLAINAAISYRDGTAHFNLDPNDLASRLGGARADSIEVDTISLPTLMRRAELDRIDLLKVDVEGAEIDLLLNAPEALLRDIRQITIELHDFCGFVSRRDVRRVLDRMRSLDFHVARMSRVGHQDTWMGNQRFARVGPVDRARITTVKYMRGGRRIYRKLTRGDRWAVGM